MRVAARRELLRFTEVVICMEGGGSGRDTKAALRLGMDRFLDELGNAARERSWRWWRLVCCGGRDEAFQKFKKRGTTRTTPLWRRWWVRKARSLASRVPIWPRGTTGI